jgi:hypothetical protein
VNVRLLIFCSVDYPPQTRIQVENDLFTFLKPQHIYIGKSFKGGLFIISESFERMLNGKFLREKWVPLRQPEYK